MNMIMDLVWDETDSGSNIEPSNLITKCVEFALHNFVEYISIIHEFDTKWSIDD